MPGTLVRDSNAPNLLSGATLNATGTTSGTVQELNKPGLVPFELVTGTVTGTTPTLTVELKGASDSSFTEDVVSFGFIVLDDDSATDQSNVKKYITAQVYSRYVRAVVTLGGTSPVYTGSTVKAVAAHLNYLAGVTSASDEA